MCLLHDWKYAEKEYAMYVEKQAVYYGIEEAFEQIFNESSTCVFQHYLGVGEKFPLKLLYKRVCNKCHKTQDTITPYLNDRKEFYRINHINDFLANDMYKKYSIKNMEYS